MKADLFDSGALAASLVQIGVPADAAQVKRLGAWLTLLDQWNRAFNLTAISAARRVSQLVLLSAAAIVHLRPGRIIDVGSGAGVPGVVLAILAPGNDYTLIDSNGKKTRFLKQCQIELGLDNVSVAHARVEDFGGVVFDTVISRSFARLAVFLELTRHLAHSRTRWLSFKGREASSAIRSLQLDNAGWQLYPLQVPGLEHPVSLVVSGSADPVSC